MISEKKKQQMLKLNHSKRLTTEQFIEKAKAVHGDKFDYSITEYVNATTKLKIICPLHGVREMLPHHHVRGHGCQKCGLAAINNNRRFTQEQFLDRVKDLKNLDFSKTIYKDKRTPIIITCPIHGDYTTTAEVTLKGYGCPSCRWSKGEETISDYLIKKNIKFFRQQIFSGCKYKRALPFDFYVPSYNICIEYDGKQHFEVVEFFGGEEGFKRLQAIDKIKAEYCEENNIELLRISYKEDIYSTLDKRFSLKNSVI